MVEQSNVQAEQAGKNNSPFYMCTNAAKPSPHAENKPTAKQRKDHETCAGCPKGEILYTLGVQEHFSCIHFKRFGWVSGLYQNVFKLSVLAHLKKNNVRLFKNTLRINRYFQRPVEQMDYFIKPDGFPIKPN